MVIELTFPREIEGAAALIGIEAKKGTHTRRIKLFRNETNKPIWAINTMGTIF